MPDSHERPTAALIIETPRLVLREMAPTDLDALLLVLGDPDAMRHYPCPLARDGVADWIARQVHRYADEGHGLWSLVLKDTGEVIGDCGLTMQRVGYAPDRQLEAGWHVRRDLWNQGFATEAGLACRDYARDTLLRDRLIAIVGRDNVQSQAVARKLGMRQEREDTLDGETRLIFGTDLVRS